MKLKNYYLPTPARLRRLGDTILFGCTSLSALMMGAPIADEHKKTWIIFGLNVLGVVGKTITNFFKEEDDTSEPKDSV